MSRSTAATSKSRRAAAPFISFQRETEIEKLADHRQQYNNELSSYRHSQCDVALMLSKNTDFKETTPYRRLKGDIEKLLGL